MSIDSDDEEKYENSSNYEEKTKKNVILPSTNMNIQKKEDFCIETIVQFREYCEENKVLLCRNLTSEDLLEFLNFFSNQ